MDVMAEIMGLNATAATDSPQDRLSKLENLWNRIPEPKTEELNAYLIIEKAVAVCLKINDLNQAWKWSQLAPQFSVIRNDVGEAEFLIGKIAFMRGDMDMAKSYFQSANKKSKGKIFQGEDPRFKALAK